MDKGINNDLQNITHKTNDGAPRLYLKIKKRSLANDNC